MIGACAVYRSIEVEEEEEEMELGWRAEAPGDVVEGWNRCTICLKALMGKTIPVLCRAHRGPVMHIKKNYTIPPRPDSRSIPAEENIPPPAEIQRPGLLGSPPHRRYVLNYPVYRTTLLPTPPPPSPPPTLPDMFYAMMCFMQEICESVRQL